MFGEFDIRINKKSKPITFCILDGWGISKNNFKNAVKNAYTPNFDYLNKNYPSTQILASGIDVGLPKGQVGNSEVGHMNIGCGRVLKQNLLRIDESINSGSLKKHDLIDIAFYIEINRWKKLNTLQLNIIDIKHHKDIVSLQLHSRMYKCQLMDTKNILITNSKGQSFSSDLSISSENLNVDQKVFAKKILTFAKIALGKAA